MRSVYKYDKNAVALIWEALEGCPDAAPAPDTAVLSFIADDKLRNNLRIDISTVQTALSNGEWKSATVLAGAVIEALLLSRLQEDETSSRQAAAALVRKGAPAQTTTTSEDWTLNKKPPEDLDSWMLHQYIKVALKLGVIEERTAKAAMLAKDFRNLIHPGRAKIDGLDCSQATAFSAAAGMHHVINDLSSP